MFIRHSLLRLALAGAGVVFVAGCATTANAPLTNPTAQVGVYRESIELQGKLSVTYQKDGQPQPTSGNFTWTQRPGNIDVAIFSPLGQTVATINVTPQTATLTQSGAAPRTEKDIDTLTAHTLGWTLPVSGLRDWLQGYATGADGQRFAASPAKDNIVTKDGWRLRFVSWQDGPGGVPMPRRIDAERSATATAGELAIHIVLLPAS